jgi:hypothetical protein
MAVVLVIVLGDVSCEAFLTWNGCSMIALCCLCCASSNQSAGVGVRVGFGLYILFINVTGPNLTTASWLFWGQISTR